MTGLSKFIIVFLIISLACENESVRKVLSKRKSDGGSSRGPVSKISVLCVRGSGDNLQVLLTPGQNKTGSSVEPYYVIPGGKVEHGETLPQAAIRELKEEANYDVEEKNLTEQSTELYVAWNCRKSGQPAKKRIGVYFSEHEALNIIKLGQKDLLASGIYFAKCDYCHPGHHNQLDQPKKYPNIPLDS